MKIYGNDGCCVISSLIVLLAGSIKLQSALVHTKIEFFNAQIVISAEHIVEATSNGALSRTPEDVDGLSVCTDRSRETEW